MHETLNLKIVTPTGVAYEKAVQAVEGLGKSGEFSVKPNHSDLLIHLVPSELRVFESGKTPVRYNIGEGLLEVQSGRALIVSNGLTLEKQE